MGTDWRNEKNTKGSIQDRCNQLSMSMGQEGIYNCELKKQYDKKVTRQGRH